MTAMLTPVVMVVPDTASVVIPLMITVSIRLIFAVTIRMTASGIARVIGARG